MDRQEWFDSAHHRCLSYSFGVSYYERHLPHWHPAGRAIFVTWRVYGSLPAHVLRRLTQQVARAARPTEAGQWFRAVDRELDAAQRGPLWLKDPRVAGCVVEALRDGETKLGLYELAAYVVMTNHVHVLLWARAPLARIMRLLKGFSARRANQIMGRSGKRFWQDESYDHWVRAAGEFRRIVAYIESNPVTAGLVAKPEDWPWSSASR